MSEQRTIVININEQGVARVSSNESSTQKVEPRENDIVKPRWEHWYQRKLGRLWMATLLSLDVEPTTKARAALEKYRPDIFQIYRDRLDIGKALIGWDLANYEDHLSEGAFAPEKYVAFADYYEFALNLKWDKLEAMRIGLHMDSKPARPEQLQPKQKSSFLILLHEVFLSQVPGFDVTKKTASADATLVWLKEIGASCPVETRTLADWISMMEEAMKNYNRRAQSPDN